MPIAATIALFWAIASAPTSDDLSDLARKSMNESFADSVLLLACFEQTSNRTYYRTGVVITNFMLEYAQLMGVLPAQFNGYDAVRFFESQEYKASVSQAVARDKKKFARDRESLVSYCDIVRNAVIRKNPELFAP